MRSSAFVLALALLSACGGNAPLSRDQMLDPQSCAKCHQDHVTEWSGSMHAYASDDPVFLAMNKRGQRETNGQLGTFCVKCHAPMAVLENATQNGLDLAQVPQKLKGVTCYFCHSVASVAGTHNNPLELATDLVMRGEYSDPVASDAHDSVYSSFHDRDHADSAKLCGSCHDIVVNEHAAIERTFSEWQASVFAGAAGATCGQCHMDKSAHPRPIADAPNVFARDYHSHAFPGIDRALVPGWPEIDAQQAAIKTFLSSTLQSAVCVVQAGAASQIRVVLDNVAAGHGFPSGSAQDRRVWTEVVAYKGDTMIYQSGVVAAGKPPTENPDPDMWMLRDCMLDTQQMPVEMFWQADSYETNQLPAQVTFDQTDPRFFMTHIVQDFPRAAATGLGDVPDRVTLRVHVQPMGLDVLDSLVASGDLDASVRDAMTTYDIDLGAGPTLEWTAATANGTFLDPSGFPASCITLTNLNVASDKVRATDHAHCTP